MISRHLIHAVGYWSGGPQYTSTSQKMDCHYARDCFGIFVADDVRPWRRQDEGDHRRHFATHFCRRGLTGRRQQLAWNCEGDWAIAGIQLDWDWRSSMRGRRRSELLLGYEGFPQRTAWVPVPTMIKSSSLRSLKLSVRGLSIV